MKDLKQSYEQTTEECLTEMFKRVDETYPNKKLTNQNDWYTKRTWTSKEEDDFSNWMSKLLKKRYSWTKKHIDREVGMFLLQWGWTQKER